MEYVFTNWYFLNVDTFLEFLKAYYALILLKLIHLLIIRFLFDKTHKCVHSLFLLLSIILFFFSLPYLINYVLFESPLFHTYSNYANSAYTNEDSHQYKEDKCYNTEDITFSMSIRRYRIRIYCQLKCIICHCEYIASIHLQSL